MKVKIVTFDIENMANLLWSWQTWSQNWNAISVEQEWHILCFGYKWYGQKTQVASLTDYKGYKPMLVRQTNGSLTINPPNELALMTTMRDILDEADIVVGWNSTRFDVKKVQSKMIALGLRPPSPFKEVDVMAKKKQLCASNSNKLDDTGEEWGLGRKLNHEGWKLWMGCAEGDPKAWAKMIRYCRQDVNLTEKAYNYLRPWMKTHPNLNYYTGDIKSCPRCSKETTLIKKGYSSTGLRRRQMYYCAPNRGGCGHYPIGELVPQDPNNKIVIVK